MKFILTNLIFVLVCCNHIGYSCARIVIEKTFTDESSTSFPITEAISTGENEIDRTTTETIKICHTLNCLNGGACDANGNCVCADGFSGPTCSEAVTQKPGASCNSLNCLNGGICDEKDNCVCAEGFSGSQCSIEQTTTAVPSTEPLGCNYGGEFACQNGGLCNSNGLCDCKHGYWGDRCSQYIGCKASGTLECKNGGTCESNGKCLCTVDFIGEQCETKKGFKGCLQDGDEYACLNGGLCAWSGYCVCEKGFDGDRCETWIGCRDSCLSCANKGYCNVDGKCECLHGYAGTRCELYIGCQAGGHLLCQNGGFCASNGHCECINGFTGLICGNGCNSGGDNTCLNDGTCGKDNICICAHGYNGTRCGIFIGCHDHRGCYTCLNDGVCEISGLCACKPGFTGKECEIYIGADYLLNTAILNQLDITNLYTLVGLRTMNLLYRASRDGFQASEFHSRCDGKAKTVTIIKTNTNYIFGGYTSTAWDSNNHFKVDSTAYVFSLRRNATSNLSKYRLRLSYANAIYCGSANGPTFGQGLHGHDFYIRNRADIYTGSHSIPSSYPIPSNTYLAGSVSAWLTSDIEVFQIV